MLSRTILPVLLAARALWCGVSQHRFLSQQIACQEAVQSLDDYWLVLLWEGSRLVTLVLVMLAKWFSLPRLETRTKESNICASDGVANSNA